ncbi:hypothetical protein NMG60_11031988 [Bertholletia excelsa]
MKMKTVALAVVLSLCFLFSAITAKPLFAVMGKNNMRVAEPVLDTDGEEVRTNQTYLVRSFPLGGLTIAYANYYQLYAVHELAANLPLKFALANTTGDVVLASTDLHIKFAVCKCSDYSAWRPRLDAWSRQSLVNVEKEEGIFQIIKVEDKIYKFAFSDGRDIRIYTYPFTYQRILGTNGESFQVEFVKANFINPPCLLGSF